ncbi:hypothetical protein AVEN_220256-1 [Araneus ventricosus]|uniref:HSF-type DNA-binding domain-containing protein n=1 Tax=Araneus ventricosus TaxID=182803 RepID=A0A4Y2KP66_ARAVE|nr:hypothetical protein AVEN_220256-1 [Araneus ventricosus]
MAKSRRFQYKLWRIVNHCRSGAVKWSKTGDSIIFNFSKFQKEYLEANDDFCKSSNISSFIRQLNLYGFRKLVDLSRTNQSNQDEKEYVNPYFLKGRPDLLNEVVRKPLKPFVESNARVKKEVISDEDSVTQETTEFASRNQERSRHKSNNCSIQKETEASRRSTRKRKQNKFYVQESDMEDEKPSTPRKRDWYQKNVFPIIDNRDNSSSPIDSLYIDLEGESSGYDCYKTNSFSTMAHNNISPTTSRFMMGQIDPVSSIYFYNHSCYIY